MRTLSFQYDCYGGDFSHEAPSQDAGYDAMTVLDQKLGGHADPRIASVCRTEDRALITLDIRAYPPNQYPEVVLRLGRLDKPHVMATVAGFFPLFSTELLERRLWIVEEDKLQIRE
ncbi:MAG: DUF5615 family PIN-like protein [Gammaproteobacteria bacterium]